MKALLAGLGLGVVAGLLVVPKCGELTRADLKERAQRAVDSVLEAIASRGEPRSLASTTKPFEPRPDSTIEGNKGGAVEVLNTATRDALIGVHGIGQVLADRIIENLSPPWEPVSSFGETLLLYIIVKESRMAFLYSVLSREKFSRLVISFKQ